jgi:hypothetical protein
MRGCPLSAQRTLWFHALLLSLWILPKGVRKAKLRTIPPSGLSLNPPSRSASRCPARRQNRKPCQPTPAGSSMNALGAECGYGRKRAIAVCSAPTARCPVHRCRAHPPARRAVLRAVRHKLWPTLRSNPRATGWAAEAAACWRGGSLTPPFLPVCSCRRLFESSSGPSLSSGWARRAS